MDAIKRALNNTVVVLAILGLLEQVLAALIPVLTESITSPWNHVVATGLSGSLFVARAFRASYVANQAQQAAALNASAKANAPPDGGA
jgi:hypothetical protein